MYSNTVHSRTVELQWGSVQVSMTKMTKVAGDKDPVKSTQGAKSSSKPQFANKMREKPGALEQYVGDVIRRLRHRKRLSVRTLASKCGFSPSFISQVELNRVSPSLASLERIASGIGVSLGQFFQVATSLTPAVIRATARPVLQSQWSRSQIESLGSGNAVEALLVTMRPRGSSGSRLHTHEREMFVMVIEGAVTLEMEDGTQVLRKGDVVIIPPGIPHRWTNNDDKKVGLVKVSAGLT
jgi:quercetin dioxygenase-like cupin family protein